MLCVIHLLKVCSAVPTLMNTILRKRGESNNSPGYCNFCLLAGHVFFSFLASFY